jgi:hypothetical protein
MQVDEVVGDVWAMSIHEIHLLGRFVASLEKAPYFILPF